MLGSLPGQIQTGEFDMDDNEGKVPNDFKVASRRVGSMGIAPAIPAHCEPRFPERSEVGGVSPAIGQ